MRVIFVNRFFFPDHSATSQMLTDLVADLGQSHMDVAVITSRQRIDDPGAGLPARDRVAGADVHRVWSSTFGRRSLVGRALDYLTFYLGAGWRLMGLCVRDDVVVAKTDPPLISVVAGLVVRLRGARQVNWLQDLFPEIAEVLGVGGVSGWRARVLARWRDASLRLAHTNVVLGERMAARVKARGIDDTRIRVIHNWCDGELVHPLPRAHHPLRREWGIAERFVAAYSGNMGYAHDFDTLLDAIEALRHRDDIRFLFVGGGVRRVWLESEVARRRLGNVLFRPYQPPERLNLSLTAADVHLISLLPRLEGLMVPSKLYGIAAAGRPALFVGDRDGEVASLIAEHRCGISVASGDCASLVTGLESLAADPDLCARLGTAARAAFEARFERRHATAAWRSVLERALAGGASRA
jgi:glycosyltransferase involved in cell wall biosynthesis